MITLSQFGPWLPWLQLVVTVGTILFGIKSAYNGYIRRWAQALDMIPEIKRRAEEIEEHQEDQTDAIVALSVARESDRVEVDHDAVVAGLRDDTGSERFLRGDASKYDEYGYPKGDSPFTDGGGRWEDESDDDKKPREA